MEKSKFSFVLPDELIAKFPPQERTSSRLLYLNKSTSEIRDRNFVDILDYINKDDVVVLNNTKVVPARLTGKKSSGGSVEVMIERILPENQVSAFIRASKSPKIHSSIELAGGAFVKVIDKKDGLYRLRFEDELEIFHYLESYGEIPLPPYLQRNAESEDKQRYQTIFAENKGAVAAPTAGLHFDESILNNIQSRGAKIETITLHVGAGTFQPIRQDNFLLHKMHKEWIHVPEKTVESIKLARKKGGRVIAIGTTVVRALESATNNGELNPYQGDTQIFIYPGYQFKSVDCLLTNFHLPESTLLLLVSAFATRELILKSYEHAIQKKYRFFSYGDAMFIE